MAAAITTAAISLGMAGFQAYQGREQKRQAQKSLQDYNRQDLESSNAFEDIPINTTGSDILREENQRNNANAVDALRNMGSRGAAMIPGIVANNNRANQESRSYIDNQIDRRNYAIAGDKQEIRSMVENRENADLAGIGQQMQVGQQNMWSGIRGMGNSVMYAANNIDWKGSPQADSVGGTLNPTGMVAYKNLLPTASLPDYSRIYKNGF